MAPQSGLSLAESPFFHIDDGLYCEEETFYDDGEDDGVVDAVGVNSAPFPPVYLPHDSFNEDEEVQWLVEKESDSFVFTADAIKDASLMADRADAVSWMIRANSYHGFSALTAVLAVNYFDRFISSFPLRVDKPWMGQLTAVASLSLAAKVEESHVPILLDLQIGESIYVFEAKTIQRMELLMLSTLQWKMNPVTPLSFLDLLTGLFRLESFSPWQLRWRCERLLLSIITKSTLVCYLPSVIMAAIILYTVKEVEPSNIVELENRLMGALRLNKDKVDDCHKLMIELLKVGFQSHMENPKGKHPLTPGSPTGVIDVSFSSESSCDSWPATASVAPLVEPPLKRSRIWENHV